MRALSRRGLIKATVSIGAMTLLAACSQSAATPTAAPTNSSGAKPTEASQPAGGGQPTATTQPAGASQPTAAPNAATAAPAAPSTSGPSGKVVMWAFPLTKDDPKNIWNPLIDKFKKQYASVDVEVQMQSWDGRREKMLAAAAAKATPDMA